MSTILECSVCGGQIYQTIEPMTAMEQYMHGVLQPQQLHQCPGRITPETLRRIVREEMLKVLKEVRSAQDSTKQGSSNIR